MKRMVCSVQSGEAARYISMARQSTKDMEKILTTFRERTHREQTTEQASE